jgi:protein-disulfide isomerase
MNQLTPPVNRNDHIQGNSHAPLTLVEYGDYQCPHCGHAYPIIKQVQRELGDRLRFVYRNFPLSEAHPDAFNAAVAAEAASLQNRFWEMHDVIFENQEALSWTDLFAYAQSIGLDVQSFEEDVQKKEIAEKVEADFESGIRSGVNGTPSFFINGEKYEGSWEATDLIGYLNAMA